MVFHLGDRDGEHELVAKLTKSPWFNIPFFFRVLKHPVKEFYQVRNAKTSDDRFLISFSHN